MNRKDYAQLASTTGALVRSKELTRNGVKYLASQLEASNGNFNREAFLKSAGVEVEQ